MFYVYEWYIVETGEVIYVGKGTGRRYKVRKHNKFFNDMIVRYECNSRIVKEFSTEKEAFSYEFERVNELKKLGQCVCNIYGGGFGGTADWWTNELREKYSENNVMKSEIQRKRMVVNNPMKTASISEKVNSKKRIAVIINGEEYPSIKSVCEKHGVSPATVNSWCIKGETSAGKSCRYKDDPHNELYRHRNDGQCREVIYRGKTYKSGAELGREIGVAQTTISRWCRQGRDTYGNPCRYSDDTRSGKELNLKQKHIPIIVNGTWYPSKEHAARALNISSFILTQYLKGKKHDTHYICEYGNQQPSQGNVEESTLEGSTTNG